MMQKNESSIEDSYKSLDTEEWLDIHFTRPIGYFWAKVFIKLDIHPNAVTVVSMIMGVVAGILFFSTDILLNICGVIMLMWANFYDSTDGQMARLTGQKTRLGRILDGLAGDFWFLSIYFFLSLRLMPQIIPLTDGMRWGIWIWLMVLFSGVLCHARQCALADYYRNIHLYFLKGETESELDKFKQQRELLNTTPRKGNFWWRAFLWGYGNYVNGQEKRTPSFQRMMNEIHKRYNSVVQIPQSFRDEFRRGSLPLMKYANILTFNTRAIVLYVCVLINMPYLYFIFEITVMNLIYWYMRHQHEKLCAKMYNRLMIEKR